MNLSKVYLSIYSYGYAAGFLRGAPNRSMRETLDDLVEWTLSAGLGGIEVPADRCFPKENGHTLSDFAKTLNQLNLGITVDLEEFSPQAVQQFGPELAAMNLSILRIKMSSIYGGARYKDPEFSSMFSKFVSDLIKLKPMLKDLGLRLLIENHQDLCAEELCHIANEVGEEFIGVNWDIGSSLALGDSPLDFLDKVGSLIGNIHLKDYQLFPTQEGYKLVRCPLGEGCVDLESCLTQLVERFGWKPMSIELGAHAARHVDVFLPQYWETFPQYNIASKAPFFGFITKHLETSEEKGKTLWEKEASGSQILAQEHDDMKRSLEFLRTIPLGETK